MSRRRFLPLFTALFGLMGGLVGFRPTPSPPSLQFLTEPQAGIQPWLQAIQHAQATIDVNEYLLTDATLITALRAAAARGLRVNVLIDGHPYHDSTAVSATEAAFRGSAVHLRVTPARFEGPYAFDHAKYWIINADTPHALAVFGSPNGTASAFDGTNAEDAIETTQPALTHALTTVFRADWTGHRAGRSPRKTLVISPGSLSDLLALLHTPGPMAVTTEELGDAPVLYRALMAHGHQARILVPTSLSSEDRSYAAQLVRSGVQVRTLSAPYVHAKLIVSAHATFVGSQNFSKVSLNDNREVGLITTNPLIHTQALAWFNGLWHDAAPWTSTAPRPKTGTRYAYPYLPNGDTPAQVRTAWGPPTRITHDTYEGQAQTVWIYPAGQVDFYHDRVVDVQCT